MPSVLSSENTCAVPMLNTTSKETNKTSLLVQAERESNTPKELSLTRQVSLEHGFAQWPPNFRLLR